MEKTTGLLWGQAHPFDLSHGLRDGHVLQVQTHSVSFIT